MGEDGVQRLLQLASESRSVAELEEIERWSSYDQVVALFEAGIVITSDADFPRRCGEALIYIWESSEVADLLRSLGSPEEVLRNIALATPKFSTAWESEALEIGPDRAVTAARAIGRPSRHSAFCAFTAGLISRTPVLFGMDPAEVVELQCQRRGDDRCIYEATWDGESSPELDPVRRIAHLEAQLARVTERFEALLATSRELTSIDGVSAVLEAITRRAGAAVRAPQYILAVDLGEHDVRVHHAGFANDTEANAVAAELLDDRAIAHDPSRLVVEVSSGEQRFGRLAALYPSGTRFFPAERRLFEAYAANASAALVAATALDEARRQHRSANALLELSNSLAEVGTSAEVAQRLAAAVHAAVLLWDAATQTLRYSGMAGYPPDAESELRAVVLAPADIPELGDMLRSPEPVIIGGQIRAHVLRRVLKIAGVSTVAVVPIAVRGEFYGIVTAPIDKGVTGIELIERLRGMASQGATALHNARLLERLHHQATHDVLTGLANRELLLRNTTRALAESDADGPRVALVIIDLDRFKPVNDLLGHAVGDALLIEVARRLRGVVRATDTVARTGGDEFAVLLAGLTPEADVTTMTDKIRGVLDGIVDVDGHLVPLSASVGMAIAAADDDFAQLVTRADAAMYHVKRARSAPHDGERLAS
jgi:diguanylate cyclase (GGDEF)-like protein